MFTLDTPARSTRRSPRPLLVLALIASGLVVAACASRGGGNGARAQLATALKELNDGPCEPGQKYVQEDLREPTRIMPVDGRIRTELVVALRKRCVPVWVPDASGSGSWQMQTLSLRTYGFPKDPRRPITEADANHPDSPNIAWSAPGPTFVMHPASRPGAPDGTRFQARLYNRMPWITNDNACVENVKCNTSGPNEGIDPATGRYKLPIETKYGGVLPQTPSQTVNGRVVEPPNLRERDGHDRRA